MNTFPCLVSGVTFACVSEQQETGEQDTVLKEPPELGRFHAHLLDVQKTMAAEFAKAVMLLAGGTLVLSAGFVQKITTPDPDGKYLLFFGWFALVATLGMVAFSMLFSMQSLKGIFDNWVQYCAHEYHPKKQTRLVVNLNWYAVWCLCAGLLALSLFAFVNIGNFMPENTTKPTSAPVTRPASPDKQGTYAPSAPPNNPAPAQPAPSGPKK